MAGGEFLTFLVNRHQSDIHALAGWRQWLPSAPKFLPAARDYLAASL